MSEVPSPRLAFSSLRITQLNAVTVVRAITRGGANRSSVANARNGFRQFGTTCGKRIL